MKLDINNLQDYFLGQYSEGIKLETLITLIHPENIPIDFIYTQLAKNKADLEENNHFINFILIKKEYTPKKFNERFLFDEVESYMLGIDILCFEIFNDSYSIDYIYQKYYKNLPVLNLGELTDELKKKERKDHIYSFLNDVRGGIKNCDVYLLLSDVDCLIENLKANNKDIIYIKDGYKFNGDRSEDFKNEQLWEEFQRKDTITDYIFDLWIEEENRDDFFERLKAKILSKKVSSNLDLDPSKEVTGKSETSYLNIIQALKDELLASSKYKTQDELIKSISEKYAGYTGLSETNIREKFAKANRIK